MNRFSHVENDSFRLTPQNEKFSYPEKLKRSEMVGLDASQWEELCIAASEGEQHSVSLLLNNEEFRHETSKYKLLKLKADQQIYYLDKNALKKGSAKKIGLWISIAAATIALLIATTAIIRNASPETNTPQVATLPPAPKKIQPSAQNDVGKNDKLQKNNSIIIQPKNIAAQSESKTKVNSIPTIKNQTIEYEELLQKTRRESLGLRTIETPQNITLEASNTAYAKPITPINQNVVLYASADEIERIEIEKPNFFDQLREKSIVYVNSLLGKSTVVIREYDSDGECTLYAVQSSTLNFERSYTE